MLSWIGLATSAMYGWLFMFGTTLFLILPIVIMIAIIYAVLK